MATTVQDRVALEAPDDVALADKLRRGRDQIMSELRKLIIGQDAVIEQSLTALYAGGNCLIVGVPGLAKTLLIHTIAQVLDLKFNRIQFTPDLIPSDIVGTRIFRPSAEAFDVEPGPILANVVLVDEINRAPARVQSALLEAMAERRVTVAGTTRDLPRPFFVMATQNPIEMEGTYPLPEAQLDRFLVKALVAPPPPDDLVEILTRTTGAEEAGVTPVADAPTLLAAAGLVREVPAATHVLRHAADLVEATHARSGTAPEPVRRYVRHGASPRGAQSLVLLAKTYALLDGRFADAERESQRALSLGRRAQDPHADMYRWAQRYWLVMDHGASSRDIADLVAHRPLFHPGDELLHHVELDVRLEKRPPDIPQRIPDVVGAQPPLAGEIAENALKSVAECLEHAPCLTGRSGEPSTGARARVSGTGGTENARRTGVGREADAAVPVCGLRGCESLPGPD